LAPPLNGKQKTLFVSNGKWQYQNDKSGLTPQRHKCGGLKCLPQEVDVRVEVLADSFFQKCKSGCMENGEVGLAFPVLSDVFDLPTKQKPEKRPAWFACHLLGILCNTQPSCSWGL